MKLVYKFLEPLSQCQVGMWQDSGVRLITPVFDAYLAREHVPIYRRIIKLPADTPNMLIAIFYHSLRLIRTAVARSTDTNLVVCSVTHVIKR